MRKKAGATIRKYGKQTKNSNCILKKKISSQNFIKNWGKKLEQLFENMKSKPKILSVFKKKIKISSQNFVKNSGKSWSSYSKIWMKNKPKILTIFLKKKKSLCKI